MGVDLAAHNQSLSSFAARRTRFEEGEREVIIGILVGRVFLFATYIAKGHNLLLPKDYPHTQEPMCILWG